MDQLNPVGVLVTVAMVVIGALVLVFAARVADANRKLLESASTRSSLKASKNSTPTQFRIVGGGMLLMGVVSFLYGVLPRLQA